RVQVGLPAMAVTRDEVLHRADEASLRSHVRVNEIVDVVDRTVVESQRDISRIAGERLRLQSVNDGCKRNDAIAERGDELEIEWKRDVIVAAVFRPDDVMRMVGEYDALQDATAVIVRMNMYWNHRAPAVAIRPA